MKIVNSSFLILSMLVFSNGAIFLIFQEGFVKMAETAPLSSKLVTQSVNFHGHLLLKQLTSSHAKDVESLDMKEVDYKVYRARNPEIRFVWRCIIHG